MLFMRDFFKFRAHFVEDSIYSGLQIPIVSTSKRVWLVTYRIG